MSYNNKQRNAFQASIKMASRGCKSVVSTMAAMCYIYVTPGHINAENLKIRVCHELVTLEMVLKPTVSPENPFQVAWRSISRALTQDCMAIVECVVQMNDKWQLLYLKHSCIQPTVFHKQVYWKEVWQDDWLVICLSHGNIATCLFNSSALFLY